MPNDISTEHYFEGDLTVFDFGWLMDYYDDIFGDDDTFYLAEPTPCTEHPNFEARYINLEKYLVDKFGFKDAFIPYCIVESNIDYFFIKLGEKAPDNTNLSNYHDFYINHKPEHRPRVAESGMLLFTTTPIDKIKSMFPEFEEIFNLDISEDGTEYGMPTTTFSDFKGTVRFYNHRAPIRDNDTYFELRGNQNYDSYPF